MGNVFEPSVFLFEENNYSFEEFSLEHFSGMEELLDDSVFKSRNSIFKVCDAFAEDLEIDKKWADTLRRYVYSFTTRREGMVDYMEFFGSPYVGLQKIVFTSKDRNEWFSEIFDTDEVELKENILNVSSIGKTWNVVGDVFNITIPYLLYRVFNSKLKDKEKQQAMKDIVCMYHYKCLTSLVNHFFPFNARREVSIETYNRLSMKYDIKKYGSWRTLIEARAEQIINPKTGIHYKTFTQMQDDKKIIYMVGDIQDRLRGVMKDIAKVFHDVKNKTNIVSIQGNMVQLEDGLTLKHTLKDESQYKTYIEQVLTSGKGFYKEELLDYAVKDMGYAPRDKLAYLVESFPALYNSKNGEPLVKFVDECLTHMFEYLHANNIRKTDMYGVLVKMRGTYNSRRGNSDELVYLRETGDDLVKELTGIKTPVTITGLRTAFLLYIVLRTLTKNFYE